MGSPLLDAETQQERDWYRCCQVLELPEKATRQRANACTGGGGVVCDG